ncbi:PREDICTED: uncharacterized protein LOC108619042 [Drosophila arizonae]|uniref:Uncharacterized protein LOC108619042 n=1 Tax=Drosophila arizonae TaxID=7263 RepID=A0ABM1PUD3_DROAR|nr:PREDICTED: uncharacterized protein LOC108619042 [Drosophila arizonae]
MPATSTPKVANAESNPLKILDDDEEKPTLVLNEDTGEFVISPATMRTPSNSVDTSSSETFAYNLETYLAERRLIRLVRKRSALYNRHHRRFRDDVFKEQLWQDIARKMSVEINKCISTWAELRYKYQRHVRRLRSYRRQVQTCRSRARARPIMLHEEELIFLYTHVAQFPLQSNRRNSRPPLDVSSGTDDVTIVNTQPPIIDVDAEYSDQYNISPDQQRLIEAVRAYPQLYDTEHDDYENYHHRGLIWSAISNELREKATKLMKIWLHLQTRYEWELLQANNSSSDSSHLLTQLNFLEPHIRQTPNTVCKLSLYLKDGWFDSIDHFRTIVNLINVLKTVPEFPQLLEDKQDMAVQDTSSYKELWSRVAAQVKCSSQRCEVTWLVLRKFYLELAEMRKVGYQLQDKWFFENIIGCLYKLLTSRSVRYAQKHAVNNVPKVASQTKPNPPQDKTPVTVRDVRTTETTPAVAPLVTPLPLGINYPPTMRQPNITISAIPKNSSSSSQSTNTVFSAISSTSSNSTISTTGTTRATSTITTASNTSISANSSSGAVGTTGYTLPYISAAITVIPKTRPTAATTAAPPVVTVTKSTYMDALPNPLALPILATVQLATRPSVPSVPSARFIPARSGLQVTVRSKTSLPLSPSVIGSTSTNNPTGNSIGGATIIRAVPAASSASAVPAAPIVLAAPTAPATRTLLAAPIAPAVRTILAAPTAPATFTSPAAPTVLAASAARAALASPTASAVLTAPAVPTVLVAPTALAAPAASARMPPITAQEPVSIAEVTPPLPKLRPMDVLRNKTMLSSKGAASMPMPKLTPTTFAKMPPNEIGGNPASSGNISSNSSLTKSVAPSSTLMASIGISSSASRVSGRMEPAWVPPLVPSNAPKIPCTPLGVSVSMANSMPPSTSSMLTNAVSISSRGRTERSGVPPLVPSNAPKIPPNPKVGVSMGKTVPPSQSSMLSLLSARTEPSGVPLLVPSNAPKIPTNTKVAKTIPPCPSTMLSNAIRSGVRPSDPSNNPSKSSSVSTISMAKGAKVTACPSNLTPSEAEMKVEIRNHPTMGPVIYAEGPAVPFLPNLTMARTAFFIREVMAIPQLHSTDPDVMLKSSRYWQHLSRKFHMPEQMCRGIWRFLAANISLFPEIAPMSNLMSPFKGSLKTWERSNRLFSKFDGIARKYEWMQYKDKLPALMQFFGGYEHLYWDLRRPRPGEDSQAVQQPPRSLTEQERQEVWQLARERFPHINHRDVWAMFKFAFKTYMEDLERGIENPWPQNWWHALEQLKYLVNMRYHPLEPFYYIVHNKFMEEVKRCSMYEALMQSNSSGSVISSLANISPMPWETAEAKELFAMQKQQRQQKQQQQEQEQKQQHQKSKQQEQEQVKKTLPQLQPLEVTEVCTVSQSLPSIDVFQLSRLMLCYPHTYSQSSTIEKRRAWLKVANELNTSVTECRLCLQHAVRDMRLVKLGDPKYRCLLSHKYYRHLDEIYNQVKAGGPQMKMPIPKTISRIVLESTDRVYPTRFLPEINIAVCKPSLVVKNWAYAAINLPYANQSSLRTRLKHIFEKYANLAGIKWPVQCSNGAPKLRQKQQNAQQEQEQEKRSLLEQPNPKRPRLK